MRMPTLVLTCLLMLVQAAFAAGGSTDVKMKGKEYRSEINGYSITFPEGTKILTEMNLQKVAAEAPQGQMFRVHVSPFMENLLGLDPVSMTELYVELTLKKMYPDVEEASKGSISLGGEDAGWYSAVYTKQLLDRESRHRMLLATTVHGGRIYRIECELEEDKFFDLESLCWQVFGSFKFENIDRSKKTNELETLSRMFRKERGIRQYEYLDGISGYSIVLPHSNDIIDEKYEEERETYYHTVKYENGSEFDITVMIVENFTQNDLDMLFRWSRNDLEKRYPRLVMTRKWSDPLGGVRALWFEAAMTESSNGVTSTLRALSVIALHDEKSFNIRCISSEQIYEEMKPDCMQAINKFSFESAALSEKKRPSFRKDSLVYSSHEHGYRIGFPEGWKIEEDNDSNGLMVVAGANIMWISVDPANDMRSGSVLKSPEAVVKGLRKVFPDIRLVGKGETFLGDSPAGWFVIAYTYEEYTFKIMKIRTVHEGKYYELSCNTTEEEYASFSPLCWEAVESFTFE